MPLPSALYIAWASSAAHYDEAIARLEEGLEAVKHDHVAVYGNIVHPRHWYSYNRLTSVFPAAEARPELSMTSSFELFVKNNRR
jgi:hypothetical protein